MPSLHIRNLDGAVVERLKARARAHHRSLQGELEVILREAAFGATAPSEGLVHRKLDLETVDVPTDARYGRDEIYGSDGR